PRATAEIPDLRYCGHQFRQCSGRYCRGRGWSCGNIDALARTGSGGRGAEFACSRRWRACAARPAMTAIAVTIAGSDSSGGAGIQADLKTFAALGVYGASVITALTAQNTQGVRAIHDVPPDFIRAQIDAVFSDLEIGAVKIGMLSQAATIE